MFTLCSGVRSPLGQFGGAVSLCALVLVTGAGAQVEVVNQTGAAGLLTVHVAHHSAVMPRWVSGGLAVGDFNRDGLSDLYVLSGGENRDKLYINAGDGTFWEQSSAWGLNAVHCGVAVAVGDYDGNGWHDVYVTSTGDPAGNDMPGQNRLYRNNGDSTFTEVAAAAGVAFASQTSAMVFGATFGDYDLDGNLDLFVCTYQPGMAGNRLFRNDGDGTFTDVTDDAIAPASLTMVYGFQPAFIDMNGDLWPELLISADFETSRYFVNNGDGTFTNMTVESGTGLDDNGMGQTVADFDRDGLFDWYVTSIMNEDGPPPPYPGNTHYRQVAEHQYVDVADDVGDRDGGWGWGTIALDLDQDGWDDIVEVNGRETDPPGQWTAEQAYLFHNLGDGSFEEIAVESGLDHAAAGRAVVAFDADNDGDLDVTIFTNNGPMDFYRNLCNQRGNPGGWLQLELDTSNNPLLAPDGFQTRVEATVGGATQLKYMNSSPSFLGTSQLMVHFGLGGAASVDELRIVWSRGYVTVLENVAANQKLVIQAPDLADLTADGFVNVDDLIDVILLWGHVEHSSQLVADLDNDGNVGVADLVAVILAWSP